jgi:hypothetical protein
MKNKKVLLGLAMAALLFIAVLTGYAQRDAPALVVR